MQKIKILKMNGVVKTMNKQTTTPKHKKEKNARFGTFRSLIWDDNCNFCYYRVKEHDLLSRQLGSHLASEVCQSLLTNSKLPDQNTKYYPDHTCCFPLPKKRASSRLPVLSEPLSGGSQFLTTISLDKIYAMSKQNRLKKNS